MQISYHGVINFLKTLAPHVKNEDISWDKQNILESSFFYLTKSVRNGIKKHILARGEIEINPLILNPFFDKLVNVVIIFFILFIITLTVLAVPIILTPNSSDKTVVLIDLFFIVISGSITWAGYVYLFQEFRKFIKIKAFPILRKTESFDFKRIWVQHFINGTYLEWPSGFGFRFFGISFVSFLIFLSFVYADINIASTTFAAILHSNNNIHFIILSIGVLLLSSFLMLLIALIIYSISFIVMGIYATIQIFVLDPSLEINPLIDMGGTEIFGKLIMHSLFLVTFAISIYPLIGIMPQLNTKITQISQVHIQIFGDITSSFTMVYNSINEIPFSILLTYKSTIDLFICYVIFAIILLVIIHGRIKQRKNEELNRLEKKISNIDLSQSANAVNGDRTQYLLCLYDRISNLSEWPINGRNFIFGLLISVLMIIISHFFS